MGDQDITDAIAQAILDHPHDAEAIAKWLGEDPAAAVRALMGEDAEATYDDVQPDLDSLPDLDDEGGAV